MLIGFLFLPTMRLVLPVVKMESVPVTMLVMITFFILISYNHDGFIWRRPTIPQFRGMSPSLEFTQTIQFGSSDFRAKKESAEKGVRNSLRKLS